MSQPAESGGSGRGGGGKGRVASEESFESYVLSQTSMESLHEGLLRPPADIMPPSPRFSKPRLNRIPFLYTDVAKKAFKDPKVIRPGSAALYKSAERRVETMTAASDLYGGEGGASRPPRASNDDGMLRGSQMRSGRLSAPPGFGTITGSHSQLGALLASTIRKSKAGSKRPELFALEAEQRALEAESKAAERQELERMREGATEYVMQLTKQFNDLKKQRIDMERQYSSLLDRKAEVDAEARGEEHRKAAINAQRVQDLEAKLEYWIQALREEEGYTKTLLHMQTRCAEEKHKRDVGTAECKRRVKGVDHDIRALLARLQEARNEKAEAEATVRDYREEMGLYYERRETRMNERRREVQRIQLKDEAMRRVLAEEEEANRQRSLHSLAAGNEAAQEARRLEQFRAALEAGFNKVMSITGLESIEALESAFVFDEKGVRHERTEEFAAVLEHNKNRINELNDQRIELEKQLLKVKFSGSANDAERDEIDEAHARLAAVRARTAEKMAKLASAERLLIKTRSGFELLSNKLEQVGLLEALARGDDAASEPDHGPVSAEMLAGEGSVVLHPRSDEFPGVGMGAEGEQAEGQAGLGGGEEEEEEAARREGAMRQVDDPERGVVAIMRRSMERLMQVYAWLDQNYPGGVPEQEAAAARELRLSLQLHVGLTDLANNFRVPIDGSHGDDRRSPRRADDEGAELEDRSAIKSKAERMVARKRRELAARFDEFGNPRDEGPAPPPPPPPGKRR